MVNLRHLHVFHEVARRHGVSAAARAVHLTQPAATQAVRSVEQYFGARLFVRSSAGLALTPAGRVCLNRIERALAHLRDGLAAVGAPADAPRAMTSVQLRALLAVVDRGSFSLAARSLDVALPTLHRAARALERSAGVALYEHTSHGVRPTSAAQELARRGKLALAELAQAQAEVAALGGGGPGRTVIGTMPLARSFLVPKALIEFAAAHPAHAVAILEGPYEDLLSALRGGEADVLVGALRSRLSHADVEQEQLFDDPLAIIVRAGHPLVDRRRPTVAQLARFDWVAPRAESPLRAHFDALFANGGVRPPGPPIECNSLAATRALLIESDRLALLSTRQVHYELRAGLLAALPHPAGRVVRPIGLTVRRDWTPTAAQRRLLDLIRALARTPG